MAKRTKSAPGYRVAALAKVDLEKHIQNKPLVIRETGNIEWNISRDGDYYIADGMIQVPVRLCIIQSSDDDNDTLTVERVIIRGKRVFDARLDDPYLISGDEKDNFYGIDIDKARAESFVKYRSNLS